MRKTYRYWNLAASIVAVMMLAAGASRLKAYFLLPQADSVPAVSEPAQPASESKGPQAASAESKPPGAEEPQTSLKTQIYQGINFLLLFGLLWYLTTKMLVPYLQGRGDAIREDMRASSQALQQATVRLTAVEEKLKHLDEEIASLRTAALGEAAGERARIEESAKADAQKIAAAAEQEIITAAKVARQELKSYAAELALSLAEKRIQTAMSAESDRGIVRAFVESLGGNGPKSQALSKPRNGGS